MDLDVSQISNLFCLMFHKYFWFPRTLGAAIVGTFQNLFFVLGNSLSLLALTSSLSLNQSLVVTVLTSLSIRV